MKKILLPLLALAVMGMSARLQAQCVVSNVSVTLNSTTFNGGNCTVNFNLTFNLEHNNGNKYIWIHLWPTASYPTLAYGHPPTALELANTVANIGINNNVVPEEFLTSYVPAPSVPVQDGSDGLTLTVIEGSPLDLITITGITVVVPGSCGSSIPITGDVWSTQSASQNAVHCLSAGLVFVPNDPQITGFKTCTTPRMINLGISTTSVTSITVTYNLYRDDGDGIYEPGSGDVLVGGPSGPHSISSGSPYAASVGFTGNNAPGENSNIWVAVSNSANSNIVTSLFLKGTCAPLPASITLFTATRSGSSVLLRWQTSTERNSAGFVVERNIGGSWLDAGYVPTQAVGGNSDDLLTYNFVDLNTTKGIIQYRIRQVDLDHRFKYSEIRSVRGEGQDIKTTVYPNPTSDGKVNIAFEDAKEVRNVTVLDMSGRTVRQINGITNNNITIEHLLPGIYTIRVVVPETGNQAVQKLIVNNR